MISIHDMPMVTPNPAIKDKSGLWSLSSWVNRPMGGSGERVRYWWAEDDGLIELGIEVRLLKGVTDLPYRWFTSLPRIKGNTVGRAQSIEEAEKLALEMLEEMLLFPDVFRRQVSDRAYAGLWTGEWLLTKKSLVLGRWHRTSPGRAECRFMRPWLVPGPLPRRLALKTGGALVRELHEGKVTWKVTIPGESTELGESTSRDGAFKACEEVFLALGCERRLDS